MTVEFLEFETIEILPVAYEVEELEVEEIYYI